MLLRFYCNTNTITFIYSWSDAYSTISSVIWTACDALTLSYRSDGILGMSRREGNIMASSSPSNVINLVTKPLRCSSQTFSKWSSLLNLGMLLESMLK